MQPWCDSVERMEVLEHEARSWLGTPFRANAAVKGAGVCCHLYVAEVLMAVGAVPRRAFPQADPNYSLSQRVSLVEPFMDAMPGMVDVPVPGPALPGDVCGYLISGCIHHISLVLRGGVMIHAVRHYGVMESRLDDPMWARRHRRIWRYMV